MPPVVVSSRSCAARKRASATLSVGVRSSTGSCSSIPSPSHPFGSVSSSSTAGPPPLGSSCGGPEPTVSSLKPSSIEEPIALAAATTSGRERKLPLNGSTRDRSVLAKRSRCSRKTSRSACRKP